MSWYLLASKDLNRTLSLTMRNNWILGKLQCPYDGLHCFFRDFPTINHTGGGAIALDQDIVVGSKQNWWDFEHGIRSIHPTHQILLNSLDDRFYSLTNEQICSMLVGYILEPTPFFESYLAQEKQRLRWNRKNTIGIHIRNGKDMNKEQDGRNIFSLKKYLSYVKKLKYQFPNIDTIYLSTDTEQLYEEVSSYRFEGVEIKYHVGVENTQSKTNYLLNTVTSLFLLADSQHLICTLSSNFCVLARLLAQYLNNNDQTIISLDGYYHRSCELLQKGRIFE